MVSLNLLVLRCGDVETSRVFYEALGVKLAHSDAPGGFASYLGQLGDVVLELCPRQEFPPTEVRIGVKTPELAKVLPALRASGGEVLRTLGSPKLLYAVVRDPDGNHVEIRG